MSDPQSDSQQMLMQDASQQTPNVGGYQQLHPAQGPGLALDSGEFVPAAALPGPRTEPKTYHELVALLDDTAVAVAGESWGFHMRLSSGQKLSITWPGPAR